MPKQSRFELLNKPLIAAAAALSVTIPASADDIDIYSAATSNQLKPNIVFVLDYSGSMEDDVNGVNVGADSPNSKISILKSAVNNVLQSNSGKINVGLGSLFQASASGVKWPVSDLAAEANTIDPAIPAGTTVADVITSQLSSVSVGNATATVNGLAEAAAYFRGDPVLHGDRLVLEPYWHEPSQWDPVENRYIGGHPHAAIPSSYTPSDAYEYNAAANEGQHGYCTDYVGEDGWKGCEGLTTYDCVFEEDWINPFLSQGTGEGNAALAGAPQTAGDVWNCKFVHPDKWTTPNYVSPIESECQSNFIVLISDGEPTTINGNNTIETVLNAASVPGGDLNSCNNLGETIFNGSNNTKGNCGAEIVEYLATNDINPNIQGSNVITYTVGFSLEGPGKEYLELLADKGEGEFYEASQSEQLNEALSSVIDSILVGSQSFTELAIDIDPATLMHDNRTYLSMFSPSGKSAWQGNLKGYFLDDSGLIDIYGNNATEVVDGSLNLTETAHSFWSSVPDGTATSVGGASESITDLPPAPNNRNLFTYLDGPGSAKNYLVVGGDITDAMLGNPGGTLAADSLNWLANAPMGDPLHTMPVTVNYGANSRVVYTMTNQGILHAFDASLPLAPSAAPTFAGGEELFAFMPKELLENIPDLYEPNRSEGHIYGLDGTITRMHDDKNNDGFVDADDGESMLLIFGMRRGGNSYYALDVTDPANPTFAWQISGDDPAFDKLAQTWSRASLVTVNDAGTDRKMLVFGGGYDAATVDGTNKATAANGNAIYMADPRTGAKVWELTHPDMNYSIPSDLTLIDTDQNGTVDRAYVGDLGGQVWRIDFDNVRGNVSVNLFADLKINPNDHQPIFYAPSVSKNRDMGKSFLAVALGTGDRTQPMITDSENAIYMLKDTNVATGAPDAATSSEIDSGDIYDATANDIGSNVESVRDAANQELADENNRGWKVELRPGEKALSKIVTYEGKILATTFDPNPGTEAPAANDPCAVASTVGRLHIMNVVDAQPVVINADGSDSIVGPGRPEIILKEKTAIPPSPKIAYLPKPQIIVGKELLGEIENEVRTVFWHAK